MSVAALVAISGPAGVIAGAVAAIWTLAAIRWDDISKEVTTVQTALTNFFDWLQGIGEKVQKWINALPSKIFGGGGDGKPATPSVDDFGRPITPGAFHSGVTPQRTQPVSLSLNVDGRTLAKAVSEQLEAFYRYNTSPAAFNGAGSWET
jgi:hypothetical protein